MVAPAEIPAWLTAESLHDDQRYAAERAGELDQRLLAALEQGAAASPDQQALLDAVQHAEPPVATAASSLAGAAEALGSDSPEDALPHQRDALRALAAAANRVADTAFAGVHDPVLDVTAKRAFHVSFSATGFGDTASSGSTTDR